ncbi:echinoderm microtubule-associated protein-like 3 isoform X1 [Aquila chrysaetos chrysaetos]|uniref:echinoderm microtubule-associated protein-like 3 isoform X1 n=2 Tax=Aquila chrysaetos chrysaetos TaxID=223781 RepID=UPI0011764D31|nr:echinoderm microtubule-associated protein-like 3 isoform X1 [Aquila chrysaetos chrysaetos]
MEPETDGGLRGDPGPPQPAGPPGAAAATPRRGAGAGESGAGGRPTTPRPLRPAPAPAAAAPAPRQRCHPGALPAAGPQWAPPCPPRPPSNHQRGDADGGDSPKPGGAGSQRGPGDPPGTTPSGVPPVPPGTHPSLPGAPGSRFPPGSPQPGPTGCPQRAPAQAQLLLRQRQPPAAPEQESGFVRQPPAAGGEPREGRAAGTTTWVRLGGIGPSVRPWGGGRGPWGDPRRPRPTEGVSVKMFLRGRPITMYVPSGLGPYGGLRAELPPERLQLDWVYGYRGRDSRSNLHVLASGELVYFIACVVILLHVPRRRQRHYLRHSDCVRCLAVHPDRLRVATGQAAGVDKDGKPLQPIVHIWDSATLLTLQQIGLGSFERGVGSLAFSTADQGAYLCVVDDSNEHMMSVWDCARGTKQAEVKSTNESVLTVEFNPQDSSSIITSGKSHVYFWTWSGATLTKKQGIFGKYKKPKFIQCFIFDAAGDVLTGDSEGNILTWTRAAGDGRTPGKGGKETYQIGQQTRAHEGSIFALCRRRDGTVLSGGGKDRRVVCWSPALVLLQEAELPERFGAVRTIAEGPGDELLVGTTRNALLRGTLATGFTPIVQGHTDEVWGLATHPSCCLFLTCGHDRQLCLWDGQEHALAWSLALEDTGLCADFHPGGQVVAVGLLTGRWLVLDTATQQPLAGGSDGNEQLSVVRFSPDGSFLAIGSHDNFIYIYSVTEGGRKYTRFGRCTGHSSFITHLDWSKDGRFVMSNSGDYEILYWDVAGGCKLLRNRFESRDREWASYTCVLGFHVFGVWPDGSDGTDINSLCRSHHERVVAVADDFCKVHLFQYPCARPKAPSHVYGGHGSHVTNVRFTHDDGHLISLGGKDTSVFQWRVLGGPPPPCSRSPSAPEPGGDPDPR